MARKQSSKNYFTAETEEYIVRYNNSTDTVYRNLIFTKHIYQPFYKLAENIIHTFKFYYTDVDSIESLKLEIVSMLIRDKISKFDPTNGAKAYSYFGTIVKRWLINYNNKNYKKLKQLGSFSDVEESYEKEQDLDRDLQISLSEFIDIWTAKCYETLRDDFPKESDQQIADAVLTIFKDRNKINLFKKKAIYIYIREITDCETPQLTKVVNTLQEKYKAMYCDLLEQGLIS